MKRIFYLPCMLLLLFAVFNYSGSNSIKTNSNRSEANPPDLYDGTEIQVMANKHPWTDLIQPFISEFTEVTGINVSLEIYPEEQFRMKRDVEMVSGISDIDVYMIMPGNSLKRYIKEGWIESLSPFFNNPTDTFSIYEVDDIIPAAMETGSFNDSNYIVPIAFETSLLAYNKEVFHTYGLKPPETMDALEKAAAEIFKRSDGEIYGITLRGKRIAATSQWIDFVHSFGGEWIDRNGKPALSSDEAVSASRYYGDLLSNYGPPEAASNGWYENTWVFSRGEAAMIYDANVFYSFFEHSSSSVVAGKVGYLPIPMGPAGSVPHVAVWGLAMYPGSEQKEAAWLFMEWATGKAMSWEGLQKGIPAARKSTWDRLHVNAEGGFLEWIESSLESYNRGVANWNPPVTDVSAGREIASLVITSAIFSTGVEDYARMSDFLMSELMDREKEDLP